MNSGGFLGLIADAVMVLIPMILSLTVHEFSHAFAARKMGDDTAEKAGRLTLDPSVHVHPVGTLLLPLFILVLNGLFGGAGHLPFFGWAKPTPVNSNKFTRKINVRWGNAIVSAAGPLSNLSLALICGAVLSVLLHTGKLAALPEPFFLLLKSMLGINVALFVFNMIPLYPLDGEAVVSGFLSTNKSVEFERFSRQYGTPILWGIIFLGRDLLMVPINWVSAGVLATVGLS